MLTPCTIIRRRDSPTETDDDGNPRKVETLVPTVCSLQQIRRDEPASEGEFSVTFWNLFLPSGTVIGTADRALIDGAVYALVGEPWDAKEGSPSMWHIEATVKKTAGAEDVS
jgi:hypothetical protein